MEVFRIARAEFATSLVTSGVANRWNEKGQMVIYAGSSRSLSTLEIGSARYEKQETLILKVPSVVIPQEFNFVINTEHPDFGNRVKLVRSEEYFWDQRLFAVP